MLQAAMLPHPRTPPQPTRRPVQLFPEHTATVAMAADDSVASGLGPVSAHPSMRSMLRCTCTAAPPATVVLDPSEQVPCAACGAYQHSHCARSRAPPDGQAYLCHRCGAP